MKVIYATMESDSSQENDEPTQRREWDSMGRENSDVSDDENFSRGAKSIESPPESPPWGGGNLDSPPASPAQEERLRSPLSQDNSSPSRVSSDNGDNLSSVVDEGSSDRLYDTTHRDKSPLSEDSWGSASPGHSPEALGSPDPASPREVSRKSPSPSGIPQSPDSDSPIRSHSKSPSPCNGASPIIEGSNSPCSDSNRYRSDSDEEKSPRYHRQTSETSKTHNVSKERFRSDYCRGKSSKEAEKIKKPFSTSEKSNASSVSSHSAKSGGKDRVLDTKSEKPDIKTHGEDLSDVSDIESLGALSDEEKKSDNSKKREQVEDGEVEEGEEQLDFEAEEGVGGKASSGTEERGDLEEGELSDEDEARPEETEPRPVCRFFSRGQCTWGSSCRFVHPGVTDKGNYTMFEMFRPLVPINAGGPMMHHPPPPHHHMYPPPMDPYHRPPMERPPMMGPPPFQQAPPRKEEPPGESAWERGLRQAKEMIRKSSKRKETEVDFEEKKMTLSGGGQEEVDKENEFYSRPPSPYVDDHFDRCSKIEERRSSREGAYRDGRGNYDNYGYYQRGEPWHSSSQYDDQSRPHGRYSRHHHPGGGGRDHYRERGNEYDYYENSSSGRKRKSSSYRENTDVPAVTTERQYTSPSPRRYERERRGGSKSGSGRGDEWADPWMRSKSPSRKQHRRKSYSSRSSYSSSSSSRTSSYSSYSGSRSRSSDSRSRSRSTRRSSNHKTSPRRAKSPFSRGDKRESDVERLMHMNPPAPSPAILSPTRVVSPHRRDRGGLSARLLAAAIRGQRSESKSSSSGSDSSGSSDDSSSSDDSGSSSSRSPSPEPLPSHLTTRKKVVLDEKLAQAMKVKAMDALKLSGQKQQIKLNLKGRDPSDRIHSLPVSGRKRVAVSPPFQDTSPPSSSKVSKKAPPSRREELLKQLKAVEDAIARKRSKI